MNIPEASQIERFRGDTEAFSFTITDANDVAIDIAGYSFVLTVNRRKRPSNVDDQLFEVTGVLDGDTSTGIVYFTLSALEADQEPSTYFYDAQYTRSGGNKLTFAHGTWKVVQDIGKS